MSEADDLYRLAQLALRDQTGDALRLLVATVPLIRSEIVRAWFAGEVARVVSGGQWQAADLAVGYLGDLVAFTDTPDLDTALDGELLTADQPGASFGFGRMWWLMDNGADELEARENAADAVASRSTADLLDAERIGLDEGARVAERKPRWRSVPSANPCEWCAGVAAQGAVFPDAESVPFHNGDQCSPAAEF